MTFLNESGVWRMDSYSWLFFRCASIRVATRPRNPPRGLPLINGVAVFIFSGRLGFGFHHADTHQKTASLKLVKDDIFEEVGFVYVLEIRGNISNPDIFEAEFIRRADIAAALNVITQRILKEAWFTLLRMRLPPLSMLCSIGL